MTWKLALKFSGVHYVQLHQSILYNVSTSFTIQSIIEIKVAQTYLSIMMKQSLFLLALLAIQEYASGFYFPDQLESMRPQHNVIAPALNVENGLAKFSLRLLKTAMSKESGNFVISPLSAYMVLAMAAYGAEGKTREELWNALGLPKENAKNVDKTRETLKEIINNLNMLSRQKILLMKNKVFVNNRFPLNREYQEVLSDTFQSPLETLNFRDREEAARIINNWSSNSTYEIIKEIVNANELDSNTALMLINSVFFYGEWEVPFTPEATMDRPFHVSKTVTRNVPTMIHDGVLPLGALPKLNADFVVLPYKGADNSETATSMYIIRPKDGMDKLEMNINSLTLEDLRRTDLEEIELHLPKFNINSNLKLSDHLRAMGVAMSFTRAANFGRISPTPKNLYIENLIQKTFLSVDEKGTTGAATTVAALGNRLLYRWVVDRPFIVVIATSKVILFVGKVSDPLA